MAIISISINDPMLDKKSAEIAFVQRACEIAVLEMARARGNQTSGTILGVSAAGVANTSLGSWSYSPTASKA